MKETFGIVKLVVPVLFLLPGCFGQIFDFSRFSAYTEGVQLSLNDQIIDLGTFTVDQTNRALVDKLRAGRSIQDFMYVATRLAGFEKKIIQASYQRILTSLKLEAIFNDNNDIVLNPVDVDRTATEIQKNPGILNLRRKGAPSTTRAKRNVLARDSSKWTGVIPYIITSDFNSAGRTAIENAIRHWEQETCVRFERRTSATGSHLIFRDIGDSICSSHVGRLNTNGQYINLGRFCLTLGVIVHEIGHALGFSHEQNRPDRDEFVRILPENIQDGANVNFLRRSWEQAEVHGTPYDYSSNMHYGLDFFIRNPPAVEPHRTLSPLDPEMDSTVGSSFGLTFFDAKIANQRYCSDICPEPRGEFPQCFDKGYPDPNDCSKCKCPDGFTGYFCSAIKPGVRASCGTTSRRSTTRPQTLVAPVGGYPGISECSWSITAEYSHRLWFYFQDTFSFPCHTPCRNYVEVKYKELIRPGTRYCCNNRPRGWFFSHGPRMMVLMRAHTSTAGNRFSINYRSLHCGGSSGTFVRDEQPCVRTEAYTCSTQIDEPCPGGSCIRERTCYRETKTCNNDFVLVDNTCRYRYGVWSQWSACSATCGRCGHRRRTRACVRPPCRSTTGTDNCPVNRCPMTVSRSCRTRTNCGFWGLRRCTAYKRCYSAGRPCCGSYTLVNNQCQIV